MSFVAALEIDQPISREWQAHQLVVMKHLVRYSTINPLGGKIDIFPTGPNIDDVCGWDNVLCLGQAVIQIEWKKLYAAILDARWLPSHIVTVNFFLQKMNGPLETPYLPRSVMVITMDFCAIPGEVDLTKLPLKIRFFKLSRNFLTGNVSLLYLPESLRLLDLSGNKISKVYGVEGCLPAAMEHAKFQSPKVQAKYHALDGSEKDPRIQGVS